MLLLMPKFIITLIFILLLLPSCSSKIDLAKDKDFRGVSQIEKGSSAIIKWNFPKAEQVFVDYINKPYLPNDSIIVYPIHTTEYKIKAVKDKDTAEFIWKVFVLDDEIDLYDDIESITGLPASYSVSDYFRGILPKNFNAMPSKMKIMKYRINQNNPNVLILNSLIMDEFGNYLSERYKSTNSLINYSANCQAERIKAFSRTFDEIKSDTTVYDFSFLIDNSLIATDYSYVFEQIKRLKNQFNENDKLSLSIYNQKTNKVIEHNYKEEFFNKFSDLQIQQASGLSGLYKAAYNSINTHAKQSPNIPKILIIISYGADNSSIIYTAKDVIELAKKHGTHIYILGIGDAVDTYNLRTISEATGAKFYLIPNEEPNSIYFALREIIFAQRNNYQFEIWLSNDQIYTCSQINTHFTFTFGEFITETDANFYNKSPQIYPYYQALALFENKSSTVSNEYDETIMSLAKLLIDNPKQKVELIGHCGVEGNNEFVVELALQRAQILRRELLKYGASPEQIRVRGEGSSKPIYYMNQYFWQEAYNRRVEIRWLDQALLPFEIIAGLYNNETNALQKVEEWEALGYKAYFERYLISNFPHYRVKLWGYSTEESALHDIQKLNTIYGNRFSLQ